MIRIVDRYVGQSALAGIGLALFLLVALDAFFALIGELGDIGKGDYTLGHALWYVTLTLPRRLYDLFPTAAVLGALLGVGGLAATSELVACRSAGLSRLRIAMAAVMATGAMLVPILVMGEWVVPEGERQAQLMRLRAQAAGVAIARDFSLWVRDGDTIINAQRPLVANVVPGEGVTLADIDVFEFSGPQLVTTSRAERARHDGDQWTLRNVRRSRFGWQGVVTETADEEIWPSLLDPAMIESAVGRPQYLSLRRLLPYVTYLESNGLSAAPYLAAIWQRFSYPFGALVLVLAGMPFVFGSLRTGGLGQRLFIGMLLGVLFYLANRTAGNLGQVYGLNPALTAFAPALMLAVAVLTYFRRSRS